MESSSNLFGEKVIKGDWYFEFSLSKLEGKQIVINEQVNKEGVTVELIDAIKTDINLTINYLQDIDPAVHERWNYIEAELSAIDNLGNKYEVPYNGDLAQWMAIRVKILHGMQQFMD